MNYLCATGARRHKSFQLSTFTVLSQGNFVPPLARNACISCRILAVPKKDFLHFLGCGEDKVSTARTFSASQSTCDTEVIQHTACKSGQRDAVACHE